MTFMSEIESPPIRSQLPPFVSGSAPLASPWAEPHHVTFKSGVCAVAMLVAAAAAGFIVVHEIARLVLRY